MSNANSLNHGQLVSIEPLLNPDKAEIESLRAKVAELEVEVNHLIGKQILSEIQLTAEQSKVRVLTDAIIPDGLFIIDGGFKRNGTEATPTLLIGFNDNDYDARDKFRSWLRESIATVKDGK